jgi:hypothetical protein
MIVSAGLIFISPSQAQQQSTACDSEPVRNLNSLNELPEQVQFLLGRANAGIAGIADIGEKFNKTDDVDDASIPMRRLVKGVMNSTCIRLSVERGGRGYMVEQLEFQLSVQGWSKTVATPFKAISPAH